MKLHTTAAIILSLFFVSCSVTGSKIAETPVRAGMSSKELIRAFGAPLAIKRNADGSQDWTYRFATSEQWMGPEPGWSEDDRYYAGEEAGKSITFERSVIHLSPALEVSGQIPQGKVVRR